MSFNRAQIQAIDHFEGPALVLAGPGSGKTTVITHRVGRLLDRGVMPGNILVVTFTKMAANEMKQRFLKLQGLESTAVTFGTFHAVFFTILKHAYNYTAANIIHGEQQRDIVKGCLARLKYECEDENECISGILAEISLIKSQRLQPENYYSINCPEDIFRTVFKAYDSTLKHSGLIDFDDMLVYCYELFSVRKDILAAWQNKFRYILVDEFQDINRIQYEIVKMLAGDTANLFVVGDDDQSIYGFRGAKPEIMFDFKKDYKAANQILLDCNYRSTDNIVKAGQAVIGENKKRFKKNIIDCGKKGGPVLVRHFEDMDDENDYILQEIRKYHEQKGLEYSEMAVLARTNVGLRPIIGKLVEYNIPFCTRESIPSLYEHWVALDIIAYIRVALGSRERGDFLRIMNKPKRYISRDMLNGDKVDLNVLMAMTGERVWLYDRIAQLKTDLEYIARMSPYAAINYITKGIGYNEYLKEYALQRRIKLEELQQIVGELAQNAKSYDNYNSWFEYIACYTAELKEQQQHMDVSAPAVNLCTMHSAKGLEYKVVFIVDANEGVCPYHKAVLDEEIEEERRMFYVAMTRAKEVLQITTSKQRFNKSMEPSRFLNPLISK